MNASTISPYVIASVEQTTSIYDIVFGIIYYTNGVFNIVGNSLVLVLIRFKSTKSLKQFRWFLANFAVCDMTFGLALTILQPRLIAYDAFYIYLPRGFITVCGGRISYAVYAIIHGCLLYSFLCLPLSFGYRFVILCKGPPARAKITEKRILLAFGCVFLVMLVQFISFIFSYTDPTIVLAVCDYFNSSGCLKKDVLALTEAHPEYNVTDQLVIGNDVLLEPFSLITAFTTIVLTFPIYTTVVILRHKSNNTLSAETRVGQTRLINALSCQALLPALFIFPGIIAYILYHLRVLVTEFQEYFIFAIWSFLPTVSPFVTLYFVQPYRQAINQFFHPSIKDHVTELTQPNR